MEERYTPIKETTKELYLKIWTHYSVGHFTQKQLAKLFECTEDTIRNAIQWAGNNRLRFENRVLAEAAKEALETRIRELNNDLIRIKTTNPINWNAYVGVNRIITENEKLLWQFQSIIQGGGGVTINNIQSLSMQERSNRVHDTVSRLEPIQRKALSLVLGAIGEGKEIVIDVNKDEDVARIQVGLAYDTDNVKRLPE